MPVPVPYLNKKFKKAVDDKKIVKDDILEDRGNSVTDLVKNGVVSRLCATTADPKLK